jgi:hypothetical protein
MATNNLCNAEVIKVMGMLSNIRTLWYDKDVKLVKLQAEASKKRVSGWLHHQICSNRGAIPDFGVGRPTRNYWAGSRQYDDCRFDFIGPCISLCLTSDWRAAPVE